jgi:uncharacterized protein
MRIPADREILALHEKHAPTPEALDLVYTHCLIVRDIAEQLHARSGAGLDIELIRAGSLLHDVGVYRLYDRNGELDHSNYIRHGVLGHELLLDEGFPEEICRFASRHTGVGLTREDVLRQELPLPPADYVAETGEETLVMYADKFHTKTTPPAFLTADAYAASVRRFGEDKVAAFESMRAVFGDPDLTPLSTAHGRGRRELQSGRHGRPEAVAQAARSSPERMSIAAVPLRKPYEEPAGPGRRPNGEFPLRPQSKAEEPGGRPPHSREEDRCMTVLAGPPWWCCAQGC